MAPSGCQAPWLLALGLAAALLAVLGTIRLCKGALRRERNLELVERRAEGEQRGAEEASRAKSELLPAAPAGGPDPVLDPVYLDRLLELQRSSGRSVVPLIVDSFVSEGPRRLERMRGALARGDRHDLVLVAHTLKGGSAQLGALRLASVSRELEESGKEGRLEGAGEILDRLERELAAASRALLARAGLQEAGAPPS